MRVSLILLSVALFHDEISVREEEGALVVSSPAGAGNFLFRLPPGFSRTESPAPPALFEAKRSGEGGGGRAEVRLLRTEPGPSDLDAHARLCAGALERSLPGASAPEISGWGPKRIVVAASKERMRILVLARDGGRLYELSAEGPPGDADLRASVEGFTILRPRDADASLPPSPDLAERRLEHDFYKLVLLKPQGFAQEAVDAGTDRGLVWRLRREEAGAGVCDIRVRALLARLETRPLEELARAAVTRFSGQAKEVKAPKSPPRAPFPGAKQAFRVRLSGWLAGSGSVVQEEVLLVEHGNGWIYEFQVTTHAGAARAFAKELKAFWNSIRVRETP